MEFIDSNDTLINQDIVIVGLQPWDTTIGSNCKNIALEFSKHNRVLYVNYALDRVTRFKEKNSRVVQKRLNVITGFIKDIEQINENLWVFTPNVQLESINWVNSLLLFRWLNKLNNIRFSEQIKSAIDRLGFNDFIIFNDNDIFRSFHLKEYLKPSLYVYYIRDYVVAVDYWKKHGSILEPELFEKSDLVLANSTFLANYGANYNQNSKYVGQGCDLSLFSDELVSLNPLEFLDIKGPIIGYVGALNSLRLDISLLENLAVRKPEWNFVLVGPEDESFKNSGLRQLNNVKFLGSKPLDKLPSYIKSFDVCLNPQVVNEVTIGNYPRKIDEYLALGKPVVATKTDAMNVFAMHTYLAETVDDYVKLIEKALNEDDDERKQERKRFASSHTWENNVKEIYKAINKTLKRSRAAKVVNQ